MIVIVPTRGRKAQCERLIDSFDKTAESAELLFVVDEDDKTYEEMDWKGHGVTTMNPRGTLSQKLNHTVDAILNSYDHIMWSGDDHEFVTPHWDRKLLKVLDEMGGSGWVYPQNGRRKDIPETWLVSSDVVRELNWYANPGLRHYGLDNSIAEIGKRTGLLRYASNVLIKHHHPTVDSTVEYDDIYKDAERQHGQADAAAFQAWRTSPLASADISRLRRKFNPDVAWAIEKVA